MILSIKQKEELGKFLEKKGNEITKEIQTSEESNTFKVIASTEDVDRHGDIVKADGWDLKNYLNNPVILLDHNWTVGNIIGKATKVYVEDKKLIVEGVFAETEKALMVKSLYNGGFLKTVSVGFSPKEYNEENDNIIEKEELLELSFVAIPANPEALSQDEKGLIETFNKSLEKEETKNEEVIVTEEKSLSSEDSLNTLIENSVKEKFNIDEESRERIYIVEIYAKDVIVNHYKYTEEDTFDMYHQIPYTLEGDSVILGDAIEVESSREWIEVTKSLEGKEIIKEENNKEKLKKEELSNIIYNIESKVNSIEETLKKLSEEKVVETKSEVEIKDDSKKEDSSLKALKEIADYIKNS